MNKSSLVHALQREANISKTKAEDIINIFFGAMSDALAR
ncbi:MAG: integration host factor subunit beta, partial [Deltaproteobacteria bacterium]